MHSGVSHPSERGGRFPAGRARHGGANCVTRLPPPSPTDRCATSPAAYPFRFLSGAIENFKRVPSDVAYSPRLHAPPVSADRAKMRTKEIAVTFRGGKRKRGIPATNAANKFAQRKFVVGCNCVFPFPR